MGVNIFNITQLIRYFNIFSYYVKPTKLRLDKNYIIYYQTWTWVFFTGKIGILFHCCMFVRFYVDPNRPGGGFYV